MTTKWGGQRSGAGRPRGTGRFGVTTKPIRVPENMISDVLSFVENQGYALPLFGSKVRAGFPSPADDHIETKLDLNSHLIHHPAATFFVRVAGNSMINAGIFDNDLLVVDRSIEAAPGKIVIAAVRGELTVKRLHKATNGEYALLAENPEYPPVQVNPDDDVHLWGVVTSVIHTV